MNILVIEPKYFDVKYSINPHMLDKKGNLNTVDTSLAFKQWEEVCTIYKKLNLNIYHFEPLAGCPDMVFCANTFLAFSKDGKRQAILSNMHSHFRTPELAPTKNWLLSQGFEVHETPDEFKLEGTGDGIWNYEANELFLGHGHRTNIGVVSFLNNYIDNIIPLELPDPRFYHLDTCFAVLNKNTAVYIEEAFTTDGIRTLKRKFNDLIRIDLKEGIKNFAGNLFCPDQKNVIIQAGATNLKSELAKRNFIIHEVETSEFIKSGGSVFCMKNHFL